MESRTSSQPSYVNAAGSQTDASEWSEYETDMRDLVINLREEGIDIPVDEKGNILLTPEFLQTLPPKFQTHAGGKDYSAGRPFTPSKQPKGAISREIQTRRSAWEDYLKELNQLYLKLESHGVTIPRDVDGAVILTESFLRTFPLNNLPESVNEFLSIEGVPTLPNGTSVTPRLAQQLITPGLEKNLEKLALHAGIKIARNQAGSLDITPEFIRTVPKDILTKVLEPVYENMRKQAEARQEAIKALRKEQKQVLQAVLENQGFKVQLLGEADVTIPLPAILQLKEVDLLNIFGDKKGGSILLPAPKRLTTLPSDAITDLSMEDRMQLGAYLRSAGLFFDVDEDDVPIITDELARLLPKDFLEKYNIKITRVRQTFSQSKTNVASNKQSMISRKATESSHFHLRRSVRTDKGLLRFGQKCMIGFLTRLLQAANVEIQMKGDEVDLSGVSNEILPILTEAIQNEIIEMAPEKLLTRLQRLTEDEKDKILFNLDQLNVATDLPLDERGNKILTIEFLSTFARDILVLALARSFIVTANGEKEDVSEGSEAYDHNELELTDDEKFDFFDKLLKRGIGVPVDKYTGRPRFTKYFITGLPRDIAKAIVKAAHAEKTIHLSSSSEEHSIAYSSGLQELSERYLSPPMYERFSIDIRNGITQMTDPKGKRIKDGKVIDSYFKDAFTDDELHRHDEVVREREALLRKLIRNWRNADEQNTELKEATSVVELQKMAMRYIPRYKMRPDARDPLNLFKHKATKYDPHELPLEVKPSRQKSDKAVDFLHQTRKSELLPFGQIDSLATLASTAEKKISNDSVRGSLISTRLSSMASIFSQAFLEAPSSMSFMSMSNEQTFDISPNTVANYREKWLSEFLSGIFPRNTFPLRILNTVNRKYTELRVHHDETLNEICHMYTVYDDHPEYYVWKDLEGRILEPHKTLDQNGLIAFNEELEFEGQKKFPTILLYFRDGFENEPMLPLHPLEALDLPQPGLCRNY